MILQLGAAVVEHVFIKGTFFVIESTIGWGYWGVSKVYNYYYPLELNEYDDDYVAIEIGKQREELAALKKELELVKHQNVKLSELLPHEKLC